MSLRSEYQNFEFQILNLKFSNTTRVCCAHIYNEKKRRFPTLIFEIQEIKICCCNWCRNSVFKVKYSQASAVFKYN